MAKLFKRTIILLLFMVIMPFYLYADCLHCYTLAKVKLTMKNGNERVGYIPIYGGYGDWTKIVKGVNLKNIFSLSKQDNIYFVKTYYSFEKVGSMVAEEDIEEIIWDSVTRLIFLSWEKEFMGACELDKLPLKTIEKLKNKEILHVERIIESVCDIIYINQNPDVSEKEFKLLIKYSPTDARSDEFYSFYHLIVYPQNYQYQHKRPLSPATATESLQKAIECVEEHIRNLSGSYTNIHIGDYLSQIKSKYEKRLKIYKALMFYIKNGDIEGVEEFIEDEVDDKKIKKGIYNAIRKSSHKENRLSQAKEILEPLYMLLSFGNEDKLFNEVLKKNEIIPFIHSWD